MTDATHHDFCWQSHHACAISKVEALQDEIDRLGEERIVLRERLNEIELGFRHWRDSDWVDSDILRVALTESQDRG